MWSWAEVWGPHSNCWSRNSAIQGAELRTTGTPFFLTRSSLFTALCGRSPSVGVMSLRQRNSLQHASQPCVLKIEVALLKYIPNSLKTLGPFSIIGSRIEGLFSC